MLPPVVPSSYSVHLANLVEISMKVSANNMRAASAHLHSSLEHEPDDVIDVVVTCDGTWSKRGLTATYGVVAVISWETGQVLDFVIKSKRCISCSRQTLDEDSPEYAEWWETSVVAITRDPPRH